MNGNVYVVVENVDPKTHDFTHDWAAYWRKRMDVYYHESLQLIIEEIGANYVSTVSDENDKENINVAESFDIGKLNEDDTVNVPASPIISRKSPFIEDITPNNTQTPLIGRLHYKT